MHADGALAAGIDLWAPGTLADGPHAELVTHEAGEARVRNVSRPTLTPFLPDAAAATGTAVIVAPGGGFRILSWESEGVAVCEWLRAHGIAAFLLKYRLVPSGTTADEQLAAMQALTALVLGPDPHRVADGIGAEAVEDALRAVALVRERADEWRVSPDRVGVLGFSAGGYVATATGIAAAGERPDFVAAIYPLSPQPLEVPAHAPPLFAMVAVDDGLCFEEAIAIVRAWRAAGRRVELHAHASGGHGFGMNPVGGTADTWIERFHDWLLAEHLCVGGSRLSDGRTASDA